MIARRNYFTPVFSLLSESSINSLPGFLQNIEDPDSDLEDDHREDRDGNSPFVNRDSTQEQLLPASPSSDSEQPTSGKFDTHVMSV